MATRTSYEDVVDAISTALEETQVLKFIDDANLWVTNFLGSSGLSGSTLKAIEKYIACHFIRAREQELQREKIGDTEEEHSRGSEMGFIRTAASLDTTGIVYDRFLAKPTRRARAVIGRGYQDVTA